MGMVSETRRGGAHDDCSQLVSGSRPPDHHEISVSRVGEREKQTVSHDCGQPTAVSRREASWVMEVPAKKEQAPDRDVLKSCERNCNATSIKTIRIGKAK